MINSGQIEKLKEIISSVKNPGDLKSLESEYLGEKGLIRKAIKELLELPQEQRKSVGQEIQKFKKGLEEIFADKEKEMAEFSDAVFLKQGTENLDFKKPKIGHLHPLTQTVRRMNQFFIEIGYSIMEGPEIETDEYCFQRLNVPPDHPARDMQDTIYIEEPNFLLRTQTSSIEAHILEKYQPPFKVAYPGAVYRNEKVNKSNHFIFHQYQGVVVLRKVSLKDLFGTFNALFKKLYGPDVVSRHRNKYYPEVEPGVGSDIECFMCQGAGCALCKGVGWIEVGGAGIIHPNVMKMAGINPEEWMGFAFGLGLDRLVMAKYKISDIRTLMGGDLGYKYYINENTL